MLHAAFRPSCMNRASIFEWHKRFKESKESMKDDEKCRRSKEVRTPQLIGQIKNFMDKDRRVSIETISAQFDVNVGTVRGTEDAENLHEVCPKGTQRRSKSKTLSWQQGDGRADQFRSRSSWCSGDLRWKLDLLLWPRDQETEFPVETCWLSQTQESQTEQIHPQTFDDPFFWQHWHDLHALGSHWTVNKEYYVDVLREFSKRFRRKRPALFKSGLWHFDQDNAPVHNSILVTDYLTKIGIKTVPQPPYSPALAPCDFWLFPKLRGCRYETIEEMKEALKKVIDTLTQEDVHWAFQMLLEQYKCITAGGDYFEGDLSFMCNINKSAHMKKVWKLI